MQEYWKFNRGSEWRKWDLHIHTKGTNKNDQFTSADFKIFCITFFKKALAAKVQAIGITDYFSINNYQKILEFVKNINSCSSFDQEEKNKIKSIFLFPNVELRMMPSTDSGRLINIHCIFNPSYVDSLENDFFGSLECSSGDKKYKMNKQGIIDFGKSLGNSLNDRKAYERGISTFTILHDDLKKLLSDNPDFRDNTIIAVSNSSKDGASGLRRHYDLFEHEEVSNLDAVRKTIYSISDAIFSSNESDRKYFLGEKNDDVETVIQKCGSLKPCIHGSDAHTEEKLFNPDKNRFCWIKADLTFNGLKQIIYEPADRVRIQSLKPDIKNKRDIIAKVEFKDSKILFGDQELLLNDNLNSIIGGKSSGKSLLLHSIAESIDPEQVDRLTSRLNFSGYKFAEEDFDFELTWKDDEKDILSQSDPEEKTRKITYIPQLYINYLAEKNNKEELNTLIKNILLQDEKFKSFYDFKKAKITQINNRIENDLNNLINVRKNGVEQSNKLKEIGKPKTIERDIKEIQSKISKGQKASKLGENEVTKYNQLTKKKEDIEKEKRLIHSKNSVLESFIDVLEDTRVDLFGKKNDKNRANQKGQLNRILNDLIEIPEDINQIKATIVEEFDCMVKNLRQIVGEFEFENQIKTKKQHLKKINDELKPYLQKFKGQKELKKLTEQLEKEKEKKIKSEQLVRQLNNTREEYDQIKQSINESLKERHKIYHDIVDRINNTKKDIGEEIILECSVIYKKENFSLYEHTNKAAISNDHFLNNLFDENLVEYTSIPDIFLQIIKVSEDLLQLNNMQNVPLKQNISLENIYKGLITDNLEFDYRVTYKNDELLNMSPGKKGTVLLILFLQISSAEHPILIDQPEDNLDNRTIYDLLCTIIKSRKKDRQIILVSHNANLVVATDSENIIVANQAGQDSKKEKSHYRFEYINGALEYSKDIDESAKGILYQQGIKEHVCDILEGGDVAFIQRERKYALK